MKTKRETKQLSGAAEVLLGQLTHGKQVAMSMSSLGHTRTINMLVRDGLAKLEERKNHVTLSITALGLVRWQATVERIRSEERRLR